MIPTRSDTAGISSGTLEDARAALGAAAKPSTRAAARAILSAADVVAFDGDDVAPVGARVPRGRSPWPGRSRR